jgi:hypothetical protein
MRRLLLGTTLALGLLVPQPAVAAPVDSAAVVRLEGVRVELREGTTQVVTVDHTRGVRARVSLWRLTRDGWKRQLSTRDGRTGYGGLVDGDRHASAHYNRLRNRRDGGFRWWLPSSDPNSSERLTDYPRQYEWSIVTDFNAEQVRHRGSGIFLHVNGRGATAGCVSAPRRFIRSLVRLLDPARVPVIGIGR